MMKFKDVKWQDAEQEAYINCKVLYEKNKHVFLEKFGYDSDKTEYILFQIYKIFSYLDDKGKSFTNLLTRGNQFILFKDNSYGLAGNIVIDICFNFIQIESELTRYTGNRNFVRLTVNEKEAYMTGYLKEQSSPTITIKGVQKSDGIYTEIVTPSKKSTISDDELYHVFAIMIENIPSNDLFNLARENNDILNRFVNFLNTKGLSEHQKELYQLLAKCLNSSVDISYFQNEISTFFIVQSIAKYLDDIKMSSSVRIRQTEIKGIDVGVDAIDKFLNYQVLDKYTATTKKLTDIPLYLLDTTVTSQCEFLNALNDIKDEDIDVFLIGLAYFATYCSSFGELSGNNFYGANIYPRYAGYKMNVATKSTVCGLSIADYALARYNQDEENYPQLCVLFKMLGFNTDDTNNKCQKIDTTTFKKLVPYVNLDTNNKKPFFI